MKALKFSLVAMFMWACGSGLTGKAAWPPKAAKWYDRADASYRGGDIDDAETSIENALRMLPDEVEVRLLAGRIALAQLEYARVEQLLNGVEDTEAFSLLGRAYWYDGKMSKSADVLDRALADPENRDPWAREVVKLARSGTGRTPFKMSGGLLAVSEMPQVSATSLVVPVEVNGDPALGLIATGMAEAVIDSSEGAEPQWVSLRFGERIEVRDVPALTKDLSGLSRQLNAPIKILLGVNLLRHLHPTFDFTGSQFVVRSFEPPPPPRATTVKLAYLRGGGMLMRGMFGSSDRAKNASLLIDTSMTFPLALDDGGWEKAGVKLSSLRSMPNLGSMRAGVLPLLRIGAFELPEVPGVHGAPVEELETKLKVNLDGLAGSGLLAPFRVTLVDGGKTMWLEDVPPEARAYRGSRRSPKSSTAPSAAPSPPPTDTAKPKTDTKAQPGLGESAAPVTPNTLK